MIVMDRRVRSLRAVVGAIGGTRTVLPADPSLSARLFFPDGSKFSLFYAPAGDVLAVVYNSRVMVALYGDYPV